MASSATEERIGHADEENERQEQHDRLVGRGHGGVMVRDQAVSGKRVSRLAVEGGGSAGTGSGSVVRSGTKHEDAAHGARRAGGGAGRTLPPPHAWLAIDDMRKHKHRDNNGDPEPEAEQWTRLLRGGGDGIRQQHQQRRSSFCVVRRERAAREAWLDRAWEAKRSWHQRNGGAPDADTPVVVVVGKAHGSPESSSDPHQHQQHQAGAVGGGGVAMDVEEVRACRDLGLELPSDCTVEIQCYGLSGASSPTDAAGSSSSGADSPCGVISSPGADPMDVKARLKVWAQAVALASTTHLGS